MSKEEIIGNAGEKIHLESAVSKTEFSSEKPSVETLGSAALELSTEDLNKLQGVIAEELKKRAQAHSDAEAIRSEQIAMGRAKEKFKFRVSRITECLLVLDHEDASAEWDFALKELADKNPQGFHLRLSGLKSIVSKINLDQLDSTKRMRKYDIDDSIQVLSEEIKGYLPHIVKAGI